MSWPTACWTAGDRSSGQLCRHLAGGLLHLCRRLVLPVEHWPASGGLPHAGSPAVPLRPAAGAALAKPARLLAAAAAVRIPAALLAQPGGGAAAVAAHSGGQPAHPAAAAHRPPSTGAQRLAAAAGAAGHRHGGGRATIPALAPGRRGWPHRPAAHPHRRPDPHLHLHADLALPHPRHLGAARPCAGGSTGGLALSPPGLVSAAVRAEPLAAARPAGLAGALHPVLPGHSHHRHGLALRLAGGPARHPDEHGGADGRPGLARSPPRSAALPAGPEPHRPAARCRHPAPARTQPGADPPARPQPPAHRTAAGDRREHPQGGGARAARRHRPDHHRHPHPGRHSAPVGA